MTTTPSPTDPSLHGSKAAVADGVWRQLVFALERTQVGIAVWDSNDRLVHSNPMFREFFAHVGTFDGMPHFSTIT